jgi:hypothetical protein
VILMLCCCHFVTNNMEELFSWYCYCRLSSFSLRRWARHLWHSCVIIKRLTWWHIIFNPHYNWLFLLFYFQSSSVSVVGSDLREVRAGDVHAERPVGDGRRRLLVGVVQRGHRSFLKTSKKQFFFFLNCIPNPLLSLSVTVITCKIIKSSEEE